VLAVACALLFVLLTACSTPAERGESTQVAHGSAAALVNGDPIALSEVEALARATGVTPKRALEQLVAERLLAQHAEARGYAQSAAVERELERARVRAVLSAEIEAPNVPGDVAARERKLAALLATLRQQSAIEYREQAIGRALTELAEPGPSP
jgi:hypothetical protein